VVLAATIFQAPPDEGEQEGLKAFELLEKELSS
jgi:hypothetical protein